MAASPTPGGRQWGRWGRAEPACEVPALPPRHSGTRRRLGASLTVPSGRPPPGEQPGAEAHVGTPTGQDVLPPTPALTGSRELQSRKRRCNFGGNSQSQSH